ncbi:pyridoxamine 5'-phosphate oxidase family protein [uncultured Roseobacter sp.]|uniref:pyridoxamine 5'-phosphate oxidase family protein n=1 Tax=uncultured Roseobacter sp. TaxID=114847 RepID=UPI00262E2229|nr:pyridoxamine 5'-phosphate oxidase family protein [uncultured Roseobacter sp.]
MTTDKEQFWDIIAELSVCMVTTRDGGVMRSRPMAPYIDKGARTIQFMTDGDSAKVFELDANQDIALSFSNPGKMLFASVSGRGVVSRDRALIKELWGSYADVFFGGNPEEADVAIVKIEPTQAEFWDNRGGKIAMAAELTRAYFTDHGPNLGENVKLDTVT